MYVICHVNAGGVDLESVEVKVQFRDNGKIANLLPKQVST